MGLFKPAWKNRDWRKRQKAVEKLTDQAVLVDIVKNDDSMFVREAAVEKITDQAVLADVAKNAKHSDMREAAFAKLSDPVIKADVETFYKVKEQKLTDETGQIELILNDCKNMKILDDALTYIMNLGIISGK